MKLAVLAAWLDRKPRAVAMMLSALYVALIVSPMRKILWHDELFTFYIAQSATYQKFVDSVRHVDWQPPLVFLTAALSQRIFGVNEFGTRFPSVLAFFAASIGLWIVLKRWTGSLWAAVPILLFWFSFYFKYATEARPYGLLTLFFILSLYSYFGAIDDKKRQHRRGCVIGLLAGNAGMMLSHILAPFSIMPFGVAELVRTVQRRRIDWPIWLALVAPLGFVALYISNVQNFQTNYFPVIFQASPRKIVVFYAKAVQYVWLELLVGAVAGVVIARLERTMPTAAVPRFTAVPIAFAAACMLPPVLMIAALMRNSGAFWERYAITTALMIYVLCALALGWLSRWSRVSALAVCTLVLAAGLIETATAYKPAGPLHRLEAIRPDLPLVDASGLAFLEMDHYERPVLLKRLYYLTDRDAAIRYAHATLFEGFGTLNRYFPLRATVLPYVDFVREHKHFLVFGTPHYAEDWLLEKLADDGAAVREIQKVQSPYRDYQLFEVTFP